MTAWQRNAAGPFAGVALLAVDIVVQRATDCSGPQHLSATWALAVLFVACAAALTVIARSLRRPDARLGAAVGILLVLGGGAYAFDVGLGALIGCFTF